MLYALRFPLYALTLSALTLYALRFSLYALTLSALRFNAFLVSLEILYVPLMFFGGLTGVKGSQVSAFFGFRVYFS
jgi:hypothetical protein